MKFKPVFLAFLTCGALAFGLSGTAGAQVSVDNPDWKESEVPAPPAFDVGKLVTFEVSAGSSLVYGVDPASIRITQSDGVVRYVMVATSASGARNVMYEGLRCSTAEFKTYARYTADGRWSPVSNPEWRSLFASMPSRHALRFAQAGGCDNATAPSSVKVLVSRLKNPNFKIAE
jgi:hypothetical protein